MLNAHYLAMRVISVRHAFALLFKQDRQLRPVAEVVCIEDGRYVSYTFNDWFELSVLQRPGGRDGYDWIRTVRAELMVPRIIRVLTFARLPRREVKFTRRNVFARDGNTCQYCGRHFGLSELTLDHVVPRARGGQTTWENVVCSCVSCNVRKGGRTPWEACMRLIRAPERPHRSPALTVRLSDRRYGCWRAFVESAHWNIESI